MSGIAKKLSDLTIKELRTQLINKFVDRVRDEESKDPDFRDHFNLPEWKIINDFDSFILEAFNAKYNVDLGEFVDLD